MPSGVCVCWGGGSREAQVLIILVKMFLIYKILRGLPTTPRLQSPVFALPTSCPSAGCRPCGPPGGGALSLAASHWPVELGFGGSGWCGQASKGRGCYRFRGLVCRGSGEGHEGPAPPGPTQQPCGLFINQESAPSWAHYQLSFLWHCRKTLISI